MKRIVQKIASNKLYLENDEIIDISPDIIYMFKLQKDMDITDIYSDILFEAIKQKAFYYIYLRSRTRYELKSKLKLKYSDDEIINSVLDYMEENQYISDKDYALSFILSRTNNNKVKNTMKLLQKGVKKEYIDEAYKNVPKEFEEDLLHKEVEKLMKLNLDTAKILVKLTRKGYSYQNIKKTIKNIEKEHTN